MPCYLLAVMAVSQDMGTARALPTARNSRGAHANLSVAITAVTQETGTVGVLPTGPETQETPVPSCLFAVTALFQETGTARALLAGSKLKKSSRRLVY